MSGPSRAPTAGIVVFLTATAASALVMGQGVWPPWLPLAMLTLAGTLALAAWWVVRWTSGRESPTDNPSSGEDEKGAGQASSGSTTTAPLERLQVEVKGQRLLVAARDIRWIEAAGNYSRLHTAGDSFLYRMAIGRLMDSLDPARFFRVHKSAAVNLDAIEAVEPLSTGDATLRLRNGGEVRLSRRYAADFHERTGRAR